MKTALAALFGVGLATVIAVVFALLYGHLTFIIAALSLGVGLCGAVYVVVSIPRYARNVRLTLPDWLMIITFALFSLRAFCWVVFAVEDEIRVLSPNNLGDMSLHLTFINYFAKGAPSWPENPIFSGIKLHYPIGMDLFNALLTLIEVDVFRGIIWVGLGGCVVTCIALHGWGKWFAIAGFLFNGGLAGSYFFLNNCRFEDYQADVAWKSIPLAMFVTQRGLLYAIPAGLMLLTSWRERWFDRSAGFRLPTWLEVFFYSTIPLFHLHTFLFLSVLLGSWLVLDRIRFDVFKLLGCSVVPATILVMLVTGVFESDVGQVGKMIYLKPGWMQEKEGSVFWIWNFGALPVFAGALGYLLWRSRDHTEARNAAPFLIPAIALFVVTCFVMFAPWEWDNTKLMIWSYLVILPFLWEFLLKPSAWPVRVVSCGLLFFSGFVSLVGGLDQTHRGYTIASRSELESVRHAVRALPVAETFAAFPTYNHPLLLSGCKVVEGYDGHLMSHGVTYKERDDELRVLMLGDQDWREIAQRLRVRYLFWGAREQEHYASTQAPWRDECTIITQGAWGAIYDLAD